MAQTPFQGIAVSPLICQSGVIDFSKTNLAASGTLAIIKDLLAFVPGGGQCVRIKEIHFNVIKVLGGSTGSNIDIGYQYGPVTSLGSYTTLLTSAGAIACDAAASTRQVFTNTTGSKAVDGAHPEDGSLSTVTVANAFVVRNPGTKDTYRILLQNPGAAAITSGQLSWTIISEFASF